MVGIDEDVTALRQPFKQVDLMQQAGVLNDQRVGGEDGFTQADFLIVNAAKRHDRCAHALGAEAGKGL